MTDTIFVTGLSIHARHGVMDHETEVGQRFVIDLELYTDLSEPSRSDRLADTVSYADVDDLRAFEDHAPGLPQRTRRRDKTAAVRKRIRRHVEHAHDRRIRPLQQRAQRMRDCCGRRIWACR